MATKNIRVKMTYTDGTIYHWSVERVPRTCNVGVGKRPRIISGWQFTDHEGCARFVEGEWRELVAQFNLVAGNYAMTHNLS